MTDFMESVRPMESVPLAGEPVEELSAEPTVRQLLAELAHLEDVVRTGGHLDGQVDEARAEADVVAAMARQQVIIDELHRRAP
ncbi:hypothetical protein GCM10025782_28990 [Pedococcus ginsenosidimutans]|uniref:Uncharacterized protein n=1 Tax=Pedococcus ginsenosidimutans TaxID=490570 RepID=A0ABP8YGC7_9MICO